MRIFAMFEYELFNSVAASVAAAERYAVLSAVAERKAEQKRVRRQVRVVRRRRAAIAEPA
jgi:hypothetical protein